MPGRIAAAVVIAATLGCGSPEATRTQGGGPGADVGNRRDVVLMHEGSKPYYGTPHVIANPPGPVGGAQQAHELSR